MTWLQIFQKNCHTKRSAERKTLSTCNASEIDIFSKVALTIERYISLCNPFLRYRFNVKASHFIVTVVTFSMLYNVPRFFEWKTHSELEERTCLENLLMQTGNVVNY